MSEHLRLPLLQSKVNLSRTFLALRPPHWALQIFRILLFTHLPKGGVKVVAQRNATGRDAR